ncbi:MAG: beta-galactosidase trimerization domain-containing protein [Candidatus Omnitrophica bacterium]|nr:beta-galactosidase trimerization domain-containing protein [Candidatus Omnitrophota bacterium]
MKNLMLFLFLLIFFCGHGHTETIFYEAEDFKVSSDGWKILTNSLTRLASKQKVLYGAEGPVDAIAQKTISVSQDARYRIWVRYFNMEGLRGPFVVSVMQENKQVVSQTFDTEQDKNTPARQYAWSYFDVDLKKGEITLVLSKYERKNCSGYSRYVDCFLITDDTKLKPNHLDYAVKTYMRVTIGAGYERPVQIHAFVPFAGHFHISKAGIGTGTGPLAEYLLKSGETSPWCDITPMLFPTLNVGGRPIINARYTYFETAPFLRAKFEFATQPDEKHIVRTYDIDYQPGTLYLVIPENLSTSENLEKFKSDWEIAFETGKIADSFTWPAIGKKPEKFIFICSFAVDENGEFIPDRRIAEREWKTLDYFGFTNRIHKWIGAGTWYMKNNSFCDPNIETIKKQAQKYAEEFKKTGKTAKDITYCKVMDEPTGQDISFIAKDPAYLLEFRTWLKKIGKTPEKLLVKTWEDVKPVDEAEKNEKPALYYYTQKFRTIALGNFISLQGKILKEVYGGEFPVMANFSDGAVYYGNFYAQGVDYFEFCNSTEQNSIWSECGGALATSSQLTAYNIELMRCAAKKNQILGHYLIDYGRKPWDSKCKALSGVAREIKMYHNYFYGPTWGNYEGGPAWNSGAWYAHTEKWYANAELLREIGAVEDMLVPAKKTKAEVAIVYSSSTDIWTLKNNLAYGFDRMHIWLALSHAQVPVDIIYEKQVEDGLLDSYKVCYLAGPNLTTKAAEKLVEWVKKGGILFATAGAGMFDEYNRNTTVIETIMPAERQLPQDIDPYFYYSSALWYFPVRDTVISESAAMQVISVKQLLKEKSNSWILARYSDGSPAIVMGRSGAGTVYACGFLPGLSYARPAIIAKRQWEQKKTLLNDNFSNETQAIFEILERSDNPWEFPSEIRDIILLPVKKSSVSTPLKCSVPLIDAVYMQTPQGILIPLANYTLVHQKNVEFTAKVEKNVKRVESVHCGRLKFNQKGNSIYFVLPELASTDFISIMY